MHIRISIPDAAIFIVRNLEEECLPLAGIHFIDLNPFSSNLASVIGPSVSQLRCLIIVLFVINEAAVAWKNVTKQDFALYCM